MSVVQRLVVAIASIAFVLILTISTLQSDAKYQRAQTPREVIAGFMKVAFEDRDPKSAVQKYFASDFVDHDPLTKGTRDSVIARLEGLDWKTSAPRSDVKHIVAEGDLVVVHHYLVRKAGDQPIAAMDMFRVKDGYIVEHWDILQAIPPESENPAPMF